MDQKVCILLFDVSKPSYTLRDEEVIAGRLPKRDNLPLAFYFDKGNTLLISKKHFKIYKDKITRNFCIVDLGSTNGTEVNGQSLVKNQPMALDNQDIIRLAGEDDFSITVFIEADTIVNRNAPRISFSHTYKQFIVDGKPIPDGHLSPSEKELLEYLYQKAGKACSVDELIQEMRQDESLQDSAITKNISRLREKLELISKGAGDYIETVRGQGYKLQKAR